MSNIHVFDLESPLQGHGIIEECCCGNEALIRAIKMFITWENVQ